MKVRHLLVAASAAAVLVGTSLAASAGSHSFSKGESSSGVLSVGVYYDGIPIAVTLQGEHTKSLVKGNGGSAAFAGTSGGATAGIYSYHYDTGGTGPVVAPGYEPIAGTPSSSGFGDGRYATAGGSTYGGSCAGSGCN